MIQRLFCIYIFISTTLTIHAHKIDTIVADGQFSKKKLYLGELVDYKLTLKYPKSYEVILPDSNANIEPFEIKKITYTKSSVDSSEHIIDTIHYYFTTYAFIKKLPFRFEILFTNHKDTIKRVFNKDTLYLQERILSVESSTIKNGYKWIKIEGQYNYRKFILFSILTIIILTIAYRIFGQRLKNRIDVFKLNRREKRFKNEYNKFLKEISKEYKLAIVEKAYIYWKNHLTLIEDKPINSLTSKELVDIYKSKDLEQALQTIDTILYGGIQIGDIVDALKQLKTFVKSRYVYKRRLIITRRK